MLYLLHSAHLPWSPWDLRASIAFSTCFVVIVVAAIIWDKVSSIPGRPLNSLCSQRWPPPRFKCWDYRHAPPQLVHAVLGTELSRTSTWSPSHIAGLFRVSELPTSPSQQRTAYEATLHACASPSHLYPSYKRLLSAEAQTTQTRHRHLPPVAVIARFIAVPTQSHRPWLLLHLNCHHGSWPLQHARDDQITLQKLPLGFFNFSVDITGISGKVFEVSLQMGLSFGKEILFNHSKKMSFHSFLTLK